jgi:putative heme iron utilization protein
LPEHISRLEQALAQLLSERRTAALATLGADDGCPFVSMTPYAIDGAQPALVLHVSALAAHTANMAAHPAVSILIAARDVPGAPVHDLPRITLTGTAQTPTAGSAPWQSARQAYLARFPDTEHMTALPDFRFVTIAPHGARQIAGFGAARSVQADELLRVLRRVAAAAGV